MVSKKMKRIQVTKKISFLLLVLAFILAVGIIASQKHDPTKQIAQVIDEVREEQYTNEEDKYKIDTNNDGVYTNYKYNFALEYPEDLFTLSIVDSNNSAYFSTSNEFNIQDPNELKNYPQEIVLVILAIGNDEFGIHRLEDEYEKSELHKNTIGAMNDSGDVLFENLEIIELPDRKTAINYTGPNLYTEQNINRFNNIETSHSENYKLSAVTLFDRYAVSITLSSANKQLLDKNEPIFYKIVNSLKEEE